MKFLVFLSVCLIGNIAFAQKFAPKGINGSVGVGFTEFDVKAPNDLEFEFDDGQFAYIGGEKGFGSHFYLTISLQYMTTDGETNYDYTSVSGNERYQANDINFEADFFQVGLGLKFKLIDNYWFRPYVEGGGLGGFFQIKYSDTQEIEDANPSLSGDFDTEDSLIDFGYYYEGGIEIAFSDAWGVKLAARFIESRTKELETLDDSEIEYSSNVYYFALLKAF